MSAIDDIMRLVQRYGGEYGASEVNGELDRMGLCRKYHQQAQATFREIRAALDDPSMALAILTAGEPKWVEWGMRIDFPASGITRYTYRHSTERIYWEREVEKSRRESAEGGDRTTYTLVRRAGYELPGGGSVTTGWTEVTE